VNALMYVYTSPVSDVWPSKS